MKSTFGLYLNDELTKRVKRAVKSGRKTGELIGPDPKIEKPLTKA